MQVEAEARLPACEILTPDYKLVPPGKVDKKKQKKEEFNVENKTYLFSNFYCKPI